MQFKCITDNGLGPPQPPQAALQFFGKTLPFKRYIWITFRIFLETIKRTKLLKFQSHLKKLNCSALSAPLITGQVDYTFKPGMWKRQFLNRFRFLEHLPRSLT